MNVNLPYFVIIIGIVITILSLVAVFLISFENRAIIVWIDSIAIGSISVILLLHYTTTLKRPSEFSRLPVYQFFALTILLGSLITTVSFLPTNVFEDIPISKILIEDGTTKEWFVGIGVKDKTNNGGFLQIPYSIIIPGMLGAYIRYLYKDIREFRRFLKKDLENLKHSYLKHKNMMYEILLAMNVSSKEVKNHADEQEKKKDALLKARHLLDVCHIKNDYIYSLPPEAVFPFSKYLRNRFGHLTRLETKYEKQKFQVGDKINNKTLTTVGMFFLAPLLAVVAWLVLGLSGDVNWQTEIIIAFGAGLSANAIVKKIWSITGEKLQVNNEDENDSTDPIKILDLTVKPTSGESPLTVNFSLDVEGKHKTVEWDYGDGNTESEGLTKSHTYSDIGTFKGRVTVTDDEKNSAEKGFVITVTKPITDTNNARSDDEDN